MNEIEKWLDKITEYEDVVVKHFVDSVLLNQIIDFVEPKS